MASPEAMRYGTAPEAIRLLAYQEATRLKTIPEATDEALLPTPAPAVPRRSCPAPDPSGGRPLAPLLSVSRDRRPLHPPRARPPSPVARPRGRRQRRGRVYGEGRVHG